MSCITKMERTGCDTRTTIQMWPFSEKLSSFLKSRKRYITPTHTTEGNCSRYYRLLLWRLKGLPWTWMRAPLSRGWRPHMGILRCPYCFQDEGVAALSTWGGAVSPLGDVALPFQPARLCKCAVLSGELCYSWNAGLYLWKISWVNCWICVRL